MKHNMILPFHKGASPLVAPEAQSSLIMDGTNALIAQMYMVAADWPQRRDFIVRAVNCHDELLASLKEIVAEWGFPNTPKWHQAKAAIQKAESHE